jgi:hypothetical protein
MNRTELLTKLRRLNDNDDSEVAHYEADLALLSYIDDQEVGEAFHNIRKWYA